MIRAPHFIAFCMAAAPLVVEAQDRQCAARVQVETLRLEREYLKQRPDPSDTAAQQRWQRQLRDALQAVAREAESCRDQARIATESTRVPVTAQTQQAEPAAKPPAISTSSCLDQTRILGDELARRYGGRELSPTEQLRLKNEEEKLVTQ